MRSARWLFLGALAAGAIGCTKPIQHSVVDTVMTSAYRPGDARFAGAGLGLGEGEVVLAGDMHCHVSPPDHPSESSRSFARTAELAEEEHLDFVVLTPHVPARFFLDEGARAWVSSAWRDLGAQIAAHKGRTRFILGMEYTDHAYGHLGMAFADLDNVLRDVPIDAAEAHPKLFFEQWIRHGGFVTINHPLVTPLASSIAMARADLSFRPFFAAPAGGFPEEIEAAYHVAQGVEAYNLTVTHLRDRYLIGDTDRTFQATLEKASEESLRQQRRIVPVGGTDSHTDHLRAMMFVLAKGRTETAIREALGKGRVCVRGVEACSFRAETKEGVLARPGDALPEAKSVRVRAAGDAWEVFDNNVSVARGESDASADVALDPGKCHVLRARVGRGESAPIYVGCPFITD